jgi:L-glutamine:2-deoxy-scyllo-inosose/3-amino-2,3-dideoxy-scyllo-inosose aminotransferase
MSKLALLGGQPVFEQPLVPPWPPVDEVTAKKLQDLYYSREWSAFHGTEGAFAQAFAAYHGASHGVFTINGTVTLLCGLGVYGIGPGDEVIVPALTWYATAMAAHYVGAKPVFVDILPDTLCIDPDKVEAAITERTKAIIPVHLYGSMADMDRIMAIAKKHNLRVIEDCAQSHGSIWDGKGAGSIGDVGSFSFQHAKTLACADAGITITNDPEVAERLFRMKQIGYGPGEAPGKIRKGPPPELRCFPFRATAFPALILHEQLNKLDGRLESYGKAAAYLESRLKQATKIRVQLRGRKAERTGYYGFAMIFDDPSYADIPVSVIQKAVLAEGVQLIPTWDPVYRFILFNLKPEAYRVDQPCTVTEQLVPRILWLLHTYLGQEMAEVEKVADVLEKVATNTDALRAYAKNA